MDSPIHQKTTTLTGNPPQESSIGDFAAATNNTIGTAGKHTVDASEAVAALQDLSRGISPSEEIDLTIKPDSVSSIGEKTQISLLRGMRAIFCRMLRESSKGCATLQRDALELLPYTIDSIIEFLKQQVATQKEMQERMNWVQMENGTLQETIRQLQEDKWNKQNYITQLEVENRKLYSDKIGLERTATQLERTNYTLRMENERLNAEFEGGMDEVAGSLAESDEEGPSRKRNR